MCLLFALWIFLWNVNLFCFFLVSFDKHNFKSNCWLMSFRLFAFLYFYWKFFSFLVIFINQTLNMLYSLWFFSNFFMNYIIAAVRAFWKHFIIIIFWIYFYFLYPTWDIKIWSTAIQAYFVTSFLQKISII